MRTLQLLIATSLALSACTKSGVTKNDSAPAHDGGGSKAEGTVNGGGGVGVRCNGKLELLDLLEARQAGLTPVAVPADEAGAVELVAKRFATHYWNPDTIPVNESAQIFADGIIKPIFHGQPFENHGTGKKEKVNYVASLPLSGDFGKYSLPPGCTLEQIAFFSDANTELSIVKRLYDELDWLSRSLLIAHELMYMVDRREGLGELKPGRGPRTSESARAFVGKLFSQTPPPAKALDVPAKPVVCRSENADVGSYGYAFDRTGTDGELSLVFNVIHDHSSFYQIRTDFKGATVAALLDKDGGEFTSRVNVQLNGSGKSPLFLMEIKKEKGGDATLRLLDTDGTEIKPAETMSCKPF